MKKEESTQPCDSEPWTPTGDFQQANHSGYFEGSQPGLPPTASMTTLQTSQLIPTFYLLSYNLPLMSGVLIQNQPPVAVNTAQPLQPASVVEQGNRDVAAGPQAGDFCGNVTNYQQEIPMLAVPMAGEGPRYQRHRVSPEMFLQRRELRLRLNREAAKRSRQRKAQYLTFLRNRVEELENKNKMLKEELRALRSMYGAPAELKPLLCAVKTQH
ncbi:cAMP-responsive element modulator [Nothobranchius furzeri]|uniref:cAMP responsive element modulator n=1 Tax=Nothobranchius furzeri TaxID=105023 RepID=A0A9D2Y6E7_NOTFU|nr:cAMP-responsive element modulator [Nothobranchius furzeri]KAF7214397.1 cAMP responsive element modulator [Nothobranchius furzeri]